MNNILGAKNLLISTANTLASNGITFTVNKDKSITVNGTATGDANCLVSDWRKADNTENRVPSGIYEFSCKNLPKNNTFQCVIDTVDAAGAYVKRIGYIATNQKTSINIDYSDYVHFYVFLFVASGITINNVTVYPMLRLASIKDDTYVPYSMTNREMTPYVQAISNPNLLDNPWFTVNQRGKSSYTDTTYCVDRWRLFYGQLVINNDCSVTISVKSGNQLQFQNRVDPMLSRMLHEKVVTLSAIVNNVLHSFSFTWNHNDSIMQRYDINDVWKLDFRNIPTDGDSGHFIRFINSDITSDSNITITAAKLELGTVSTLAMDTAPNYQQELAKCQRYFVRLGGNSIGYPIAIGRAHKPTQGRYLIKLPVPMRSTAIVTFSDFTKVREICNHQQIAPTSFSAGGMNAGGYLNLYTTTSGLVTDDLCGLLLQGESIDVSADL